MGLAKKLKTSLLVVTAMVSFLVLLIVGTVVSLGVVCYVSDSDNNTACKMLDGKITVSRLNK